MKNRLTACTALLVFLLAPFASRALGQAAASGKIGVINIQEAIGTTGEGKKAFGDLEKKYRPRQQELQRLQQEIQAINDQLAKGQNTLSDEEQRRLARDAEDKQKLLKRSTEDAQADFGADRDEAIRRIGQKMVKVIQEYATASGLSLVIDDAQIPIYYASPEMDITAAIVKKFDIANPVAESEVPAAPGAKPPTAPAAKPPAAVVKPPAAGKPPAKP
jgi:outer membrane protein